MRLAEEADALGIGVDAELAHVLGGRLHVPRRAVGDDGDLAAEDRDAGKEPHRTRHRAGLAPCDPFVPSREGEAFAAGRALELELHVVEDRVVRIDDDDSGQRGGLMLLRDFLEAVPGCDECRLGQRLELGGLRHPGKAAFRLERLIALGRGAVFGLGERRALGLRLRLGAQIGGAHSQKRD
jgi:hypothetical protein